MSVANNERVPSDRVAELLKSISENVSGAYGKGYEDGYAKGVEDSTPSIFYLDSWGTTYTLQFRKGMTWGEWCVSAYNTEGWYITDWDSVYTGAVGIMEVSTGLYPGRDTPINEGSTYTYGM